MEKIPLSLAVITLDEEDNIARCIQSASFASEVVVVDSFSTDKTKEIAEKLGAKVVEQDWLGFEQQKQKATDLCSNDWVLSLDADEEVSPELAQELQKLFASPEKLQAVNAYKIPRLSWHFGRWIRHGGWYPDFQVRLFNRQQAKWVGGELHESIQTTGPLGQLTSNLHHYVFKDLSHQVLTNDRYSSLGAEKMIRQGKGSSLLKMMFRPIGKFVECYFIKKGFLDGIPGFIIAVGAAYSLFLRYAKVYEWQLKNK